MGRRATEGGQGEVGTMSDDYSFLPFLWQLELVQMSGAPWYVKARALWLRVPVWDVLRERTRISWLQAGGEEMSDERYGLWLNSLPSDEFINLMLCTPAEDEEAEDEELDGEGWDWEDNNWPIGFTGREE